MLRVFCFVRLTLILIKNTLFLFVPNPLPLIGYDKNNHVIVLWYDMITLFSVGKNNYNLGFS